MNDKNSDQEPKPGSMPKAKKGLRVSRVIMTLGLLTGLGMFAFWFVCIRMPGESFASIQENESKAKPLVQEKSKSDAKSKSDGAPSTAASETAQPETTSSKQTEEDAAKGVDTRRAAFEKEAKKYVVHLSETIGERNLRKYKSLNDAADYIEQLFKDFGYTASRQEFQVRGFKCFNIEVEIKGKSKPDEIVIIGGHYDSAQGTPGANDNGSGTAAMLVLANHFKKYQPERTLRFVAWTNEEPPYFQRRDLMGSWVYAERCRKKNENIVGVISLETMGYFTNQPDTQKYPAPLNLLYPSTGNFIGFVSDVNSGGFQRQVIKVFRDKAKIASEGASLPDALPGVGWSDHWSFWQEGYVGLMVTDTAPFRYPHYHKATDTPDKINFVEYSKVIDGLVYVVEDLVKSKQ